MHLPRVAAAASLGLTLAAAAAAQDGSSSSGAADDRVMAIVNDVPIRRSEIIEAAKAAPPELRGLPLEMVYPRILDRLVNIKLVAAQGRKANIEDDEEVRRRVAEATDRIIQEVYLTRYVRERITEEGLRDRYDRLIDRDRRMEELSVSHILLGNEERAREVLSKLNGGDDFETLARIYSIGPEARNGGAMGFIGEGDMPRDFFEVARALDEGDYAGRPVRSAFGWHVVRLDDRRTLPPPSLVEVKPALTRQWSQEIIADLLTRLQSEASIQRFDFDVTGIAPPGKEEIQGGGDVGAGGAATNGDVRTDAEPDPAPDPGVEPAADDEPGIEFPELIELDPLGAPSDG